MAELDPSLFVETGEIERICTLIRGKGLARDTASPPRRRAKTIP